MANLKKGCSPATIDSNSVGLRYAEEDCPGVLPATPTWKPLDPNSYADFSASYTLVNRDTINANRQLQKGTIADVDATFGVNQDVTMDNLDDLLQGFFFATARERATTKTVSGTANTTISKIEANVITLAANVGFAAGQYVVLSGFTDSTNNGLKLIKSVAAGAITFDDTTPVAAEASVATTAIIRVAGFSQTGVSLSMGTNYLMLTTGAALSAIPGEWIYITGVGDISFAPTVGFTNNKGYARVHHIVGNVAYLDKWSWTPVKENASVSVGIMVGTIIRNEADPQLIVQRTYQFERTLGNDADGVQSEYSIGAVANELTLNVQNAEKITADIGYISMRNEERTGSVGVKAGNRPDMVTSREGLNGTTDMYRVNLSILKDGLTVPDSALFSYATEMTMTINNNINARKAIGVLGAVSMTAGNFQVGGSITAYLTDVRAVEAIRNNSDVSIDAIIQRGHMAQVWDIPLLSLSNGAIAVTKDEAITIPLDINGAESDFGYTMQYMQFPWVAKTTY